MYEMPDYCVKAAATEHGMPGLAWCLEERPRLGVFHPETAMELGIKPGPDFGKLQRGEAITTAEGRVVQPGEVMDEARAGRKIVITGDTRPTAAVIELARGASVLVHDSTFAETEKDRAFETGHSTAKEAAEVARAAGVATLVLTLTDVDGSPLDFTGFTTTGKTAGAYTVRAYYTDLATVVDA